MARVTTVPLNPGPQLPATVRQHLEQSPGLESPSVWIGLLVVTVLVAIALLGWSLRRPLTGRAKWARRIGGSLTVLLLGLASTAAWVNSWVGYFPTMHTLTGFLSGGNPVDQPTGLPSGTALLASGSGPSSTVFVNRLADPALDIRPGPVYTYLPPGYDSAANKYRRYPVVYLLEGFPGRSADWFAAGQAAQTMDLLIAAHVVPPMILISPDVAAGRGLYDSECLNAVGGPQVETFLTRDVVAWADRHLRTIANRTSRVIGGMSSGGYCALNLGLRHQDRYGVILGMQPYGDPGRSGYAHLGWRRSLMYANTPTQYIPRMRIWYRMAAMLDSGQDDPGGIIRAHALAEALAERGLPVALRVEPGDTHSWRAARHGLPYMLDFAAHYLRFTAPPASPARPGPAARDHYLTPVAG